VSLQEAKLTTLLFLGAGASSPFGIPTMTEMVSKFEKYLKDENIPQRLLYSQIKDTLSKGFNTTKIDIESVFSVIAGISSGVTSKDMGAMPYYYIRRHGSEIEFSPKEIEDAKILQDELEKFIKKECQFSGTDDEKQEAFENSYEALFRSLPGIHRMKG